jgi:hypothetical protein
MRNAYIAVRKPEEKRPLGYFGVDGKDNIKIDLKEKGVQSVYWI